MDMLRAALFVVLFLKQHIWYNNAAGKNNPITQKHERTGICHVQIRT